MIVGFNKFLLLQSFDLIFFHPFNYFHPFHLFVFLLIFVS